MNVRKILCNSLVQPFLEYGITAWGSAKRKLLGKIEQLQKKAVRCISNSSYNSHTEPLFGKLKLLKLSDIFDIASKTIMFKYKTGKLPKSFDNMFEELALGNRAMSYRIEKIRHTSLNIFPKVYLPKIWNALPLDVKSSSSIKIFQKSIKNVAFETYETFQCSNNKCYACKTC